MNGKRKLVVVVLFLMMMVTAVAYAAWSDTIDVHGTVDTGDFDVHWVDPVVSKTATGVGGDAEGRVTATHSTDDHYTIVVENAKPGEVYTVQLKAENKGSLEAVRQSMTLDVTAGVDGATTSDFVKGTGPQHLYVNVNSPASASNTQFVVEATSTDSGILAKTGADGTGGGQETFTIKVTVPSDDDSDINERTEGYDDVVNSITFDFDVVYAQRGFTADPVPVPTNPHAEQT